MADSSWIKKNSARQMYEIAKSVENSEERYSFKLLGSIPLLVDQKKIFGLSSIVVEDCIINHGQIISIKMRIKDSLNLNQPDFDELIEILVKLTHLRSFSFSHILENALPKKIGNFEHFCEGFFCVPELFSNHKVITNIFSEDESVRQNFARLKESVNFPEFDYFFRDKEYQVRVAAAANLYATCRKAYRILLKDCDEDVRLAVAINPFAIGLPEYRKLFYDNESIIRKVIAENLVVTSFPE